MYTPQQVELIHEQQLERLRSAVGRPLLGGEAPRRRTSGERVPAARPFRSATERLRARGLGRPGRVWTRALRVVRRAPGSRAA